MFSQVVSAGALWFGTRIIVILGFAGQDEELSLQLRGQGCLQRGGRLGELQDNGVLIRGLQRQHRRGGVLEIHQVGTRIADLRPAVPGVKDVLSVQVAAV